MIENFKRKIQRFVSVGFFLSLTFIHYSSYCQKLNMYWNDYSSFNPGSSGLFHNFQGVSTLILQEYFAGHTPYYFANSFNAKVDKLHGGIGLNYYQSKFDFISQLGFKINYSFHFNFGNNNILGIGISPSLRHTLIDFVAIYPDDDIITDRITKTYDDFGAELGLVFKTNKLVAGYSYKTLANKSQFENYNISTAFLSYNFNISNLIIIRPGFYFEYNSYQGSSLKRLNSNLTFTYKDRFWIYGFHRDMFDYADDDKWFGIGLGYDIIGKYRLGYSRYFDSDKSYLSTDEFVFSVMIN